MAEPFLPPTIPVPPTPLPLPFPPWQPCTPRPLPWDDYWISGPHIQRLFSQVKIEMATFDKLSDEGKEEFVAVRFNLLQERGLLTSDEVNSIRGASRSTATAVPPLFNPDGSPSLCGTIASMFVSARTRGRRDAAIAAGAVVGAGFGAYFGQVGGAIAGAAVGALLVAALWE